MKILKDDNIDLLRFEGKQESQYLASPADFSTEIDELFDAEHRGAIGDEFPWTKTHGKIGLRKGELSIWHGWAGHGKSQMLGMVIGWLTPKRKCLIASLETKPAQTIRRMMRQCSGTAYPERTWRRQWEQYTNGRLWLYDQTDTVEEKRIRAMIYYAATEHGIEHFVIDSLMKCGVKGADQALYANQKEFVDKLAWLAKALNIHIHLVAHSRKGHDETRIPEMHDISGSSDIGNMAWNVFAVWKNKRKLDAQKAGKTDYDEEPDARLKVQKNRDGEWEGTIRLWFDAPSQQFTPEDRSRAIKWPGELTPVPDNVQPLKELYEPGVNG